MLHTLGIKGIEIHMDSSSQTLFWCLNHLDTEVVGVTMVDQVKLSKRWSCHQARHQGGSQPGLPRSNLGVVADSEVL